MCRRWKLRLNGDLSSETERSMFPWPQWKFIFLRDCCGNIEFFFLRISRGEVLHGKSCKISLTIWCIFDRKWWEAVTNSWRSIWSTPVHQLRLRTRAWSRKSRLQAQLVCWTRLLVEVATRARTIPAPVTKSKPSCVLSGYDPLPRMYSNRR